MFPVKAEGERDRLLVARARSSVIG
jgi:hypothetical protein